MSKKVRSGAKLALYKEKTRKFDVPADSNGQLLKVSQYFGDNVFNYQESNNLTENDKKTIASVIDNNETLSKEIAEKFANAILRWATEKGASHFCHWFQPLTGATAEKHDAFLSIEGGKPIEKLSASQLIQGEPDASSFPNGGARSTFEARGYTSWDLSSTIFIRSTENGKTLCIPTAFVSYFGDALDIKTPLLRSISVLGGIASNFCNLVSGNKREADQVQHVDTTCGIEQEYFLIDKSLYFERPDLVMTGRALYGGSTSRNQQLDDHYFGAIPDRVLSYMQEVEVELYKLGIPAKTRHNEVAPGQFEIAPIFGAANISADQNQLVMAVLKSVAEKHNMVCLLHEKPFPGINGSGKHLNWSMSDDKGNNLLNPTKTPETNYQFLTIVSIICEAVKRHSGLLRAGIASQGNDHRLGANEAPPSIISAFLGSTLTTILESYADGKPYKSDQDSELDTGADQLATLFQDNTDRNRTSPFAFTGNRFEFRAVGSSQAVGVPMAYLNAAVADVLEEANVKIEKELEAGKDINDVLMGLIKEYYGGARDVVFNGDGYSDEWVTEAEKRGLPNLRTTADALPVLKDKKQTEFLTRLGIYRPGEIETRYNVSIERYNTLREIEFNAFVSLIKKEILPTAFKYKEELASTINASKTAGGDTSVESIVLSQIDTEVKSLHSKMNELVGKMHEYSSLEDGEFAMKIAKELMPLSEEMADNANTIENLCPDYLWGLPTFYDLLFIK